MVVYTCFGFGVVIWAEYVHVCVPKLTSGRERYMGMCPVRTDMHTYIQEGAESVHVCVPKLTSGPERYMGMCPVGSYSGTTGACIPCPIHMTTL